MSLEDEDEEEISASSYPNSVLSVNVNYLVDEANLLDKLKAARLHVLSSEQWNASQIKLCHRYIISGPEEFMHFFWKI